MLKVTIEMKSLLWIFQICCSLPVWVLRWSDLPVYWWWRNPDLSCSSHLGWFSARQTSLISLFSQRRQCWAASYTSICKPNGRSLVSKEIVYTLTKKVPAVLPEKMCNVTLVFIHSTLWLMLTLYRVLTKILWNLKKSTLECYWGP